MAVTTTQQATQLGNFIRECRKGLKYTSREVARRSNVRTDIPSISNSYLISVENGKHIPRLDKVIALADILNVPITHLVDRCREDLGGRGGMHEEGDFQSLFAAGREHADMNEHGRALEFFRKAFDFTRNAHAGSVSPADVSELRLQIANCYKRLKINRVAKEELEALLRERGLEPRTRARVAFLLSEIYREEQSTFLGAILAREALAMARQVGDEVIEGKILSALGNLSAEEGRLDEALIFYRDAAAKLKRLGHEGAYRLARTRQGFIMVEQGEHFKAIELLRIELNECRPDDTHARGWLHLGLAKAYYRADNVKSARSHARNAKECAEKVDAPEVVFMAVYYLWRVAQREQTSDLATVYFERLKSYRSKIEVRYSEIEQFDKFRSQSAEKGVMQ